MTIIKQLVEVSIGALAIASPLLFSSVLPAVRAESQPVIQSVSVAKDAIVSVRREGGFCRPGGCFSEVAIFADGTYRYSDPTQQKTGNLNRLEIQRFQKRIAAANFQKIKSQPFTGTCPLAYDGPETVYTFRKGDLFEISARADRTEISARADRTEISARADRTEVIRSCQTQIDGKNPLFQQAERVYRQITIVSR
ncbi:hypothetical protein [Phormidesmis priestleyi]